MTHAISGDAERRTIDPENESQVASAESGGHCVYGCVLGAHRHPARGRLPLIRKYVYLYGAVSPKDGTCM
jgi:hypothetical protein